MIILSADDDRQNLYLIEAVGRSQGHTVISVRNGAEALEQIERQLPDLVISDILMPVMDGFQLCHELKSHERTRNIPFIFYTATYTSKQDEYLALSLGAARFFVKPVDPESFVTLIDEVMAEARSGKTAAASAEPRDVITYLKAYTQSLVRKLDRKIEQAEAARQDLQRMLAERDAEIARRIQAEEERSRLEAQFLQAQKLESLGRLAGGVAHDFNNLLTVINGYSDLALRQLDPHDPLRTSLNAIQTAGLRAADLTRQLLAFSRKQIAEPARLDLNALIGEMRPMLQRLMGEDVEVVTQLAPELGLIMADPGSLHQVLMNLAVNARDAMPRGGRFLIETANVELDAAGTAELPELKPGAYVRLIVGDNGIGMSEETRQRIFDPFFTTKSAGEGTGLGLSTVYGIVRQAGGAIVVKSDLGQGATFLIHLPAITDCQETCSPDAAPSAAQRGTETILVVEDQEDLRRLAALALNSSGYRTLEAGNGGEALLAVEGHNGPIDLMLTDVVMPGMTGKELVERLKQLRPEMKVLYMSGYSGDEMIRRGLLEAGDVHIAKPFSPDSLSGKVREILGPAKVATTILVVDDEVGVREYFRQVLVDAGYQVLLAGDGEEAMTIAKSQPVQAVLMDLVMPGQEGLETIQALRQQVPGARVIAVSGGFGGQFLGVARMLGADATMSKPVSPDELLSKLAGVLAPKTA